MTLRYHDQIGCNISKIISRLISLVFSVCMNIHGPTPREHHEILAENRGTADETCYLFAIYDFAFKAALTTKSPSIHFSVVNKRITSKVWI